LVSKIVTEDQSEQKRRSFLVDERDRAKKEKSYLVLSVGLAAGFLTGFAFGGFFWLSMLIFPIVGEWASGFNDQAKHESFLEQLEQSEQFAKKYTWYQNELAESSNLYACISKGMPFVLATLDKWADSGVTKADVLSNIEIEFSKGF